MTNDLNYLAKQLLTNFVTIRFPRIGPSWDWPQPLPEAELRRMEQWVRTERLINQARRRGLDEALSEMGHWMFLSTVEGNVTGDWRIHFFCADIGATHILVGLTNGQVGPGAPIAIKPREFVERRLRQIANSCGSTLSEYR
jgi:hypothetical protein